jgi:hypothetical protein
LGPRYFRRHPRLQSQFGINSPEAPFDSAQGDGDRLFKGGKI